MHSSKVHSDNLQNISNMTQDQANANASKLLLLIFTFSI